MQKAAVDEVVGSLRQVRTRIVPEAPKKLTRDLDSNIIFRDYNSNTLQTSLIIIFYAYDEVVKLHNWI